LITAGLGWVLLPTLSNYYEDGNIQMVKRIIRLSVKYFLLFAIPYFVGTIILGRPVLRLFTTAEIAQEGYEIIALTGLAGIFMGIYTIFKQAIYLKKETKLISIFWGLAAAINVGGNLYLVPEIGIIGAGITTVLSYVFVMILVLNFAFKNFELKVNYLDTTKIVFSSILMGNIVLISEKYVWDNLFFLIVLGSVIYILILFLVKVLTLSEVKFLKNL